MLGIITEKDKKDIIDYCYDKMTPSLVMLIEKHGYKPNIFMELLYNRAIYNYLHTPSMEVSEEDMHKIFAFVKNTEDTMMAFLQGQVKLIAINDDHLIYEIRKLIKTNE